MTLKPVAGCVAAGLLLLIASACSLRPMVVGETARMVTDGLVALEHDDDLDMLEKALPANIKLLETLLAGDSDNSDMLVLLARLYAAYSFTFPESRLEAARLQDADSSVVAPLRAAVDRYYRKGTEYALRALEVRYPNCRQRMLRAAEGRRFLAAMDRRDVPALFWYAFNTGAWINQNRDSVAAVARAHLVEAAMLRVVELEPGYYHAGAHLFLLTYYASRSPMMGGSPEKARHHYERVRSLAGKDFLLADTYFARYYLVQTQAREAYLQRLTSVTRAAAIDSRHRLLNRVAVERAGIYLGAVDRLFD